MPVVPDTGLLLDLLLVDCNPEHIPVHNQVDIAPVDPCTCTHAHFGPAAKELVNPGMPPREDAEGTD